LDEFGKIWVKFGLGKNQILSPQKHSIFYGYACLHAVT